MYVYTYIYVCIYIYIYIYVAATLKVDSAVSLVAHLRLGLGLEGLEGLEDLEGLGLEGLEDLESLGLSLGLGLGLGLGRGLGLGLVLGLGHGQLPLSSRVLSVEVIMAYLLEKRRSALQVLRRKGVEPWPSSILPW